MMCENKPHLVIYGKKDCPQCEMTVKYLDRHETGFTYINIEHDEDAYNYVTKTLGFLQAPAVVALYPNGSEQSWAGFRPDRLQGYVSTAARFHDDS